MQKNLFRQGEVEVVTPTGREGLLDYTKSGPPSRQPEYWIILVDVGGTKQKAILAPLDKEGNLLGDAPAKSVETETRKGREKHYEGVAELVMKVKDKDGVKVLPLVCLGTPGRLVDGVIQTGSAQNLGEKSLGDYASKHEFDGVNPAEELRKKLLERGVEMKVFAGNDALAQMGAALNILLQDESIGIKIKGKVVGYVGPGTGLGGGFAKVDERGDIEFITDGHIYDLMIPGFEEKSEFTFRIDGGKVTAALPEKKLKAEDLLSGRAVRQIACAIDRAAVKAGLMPVFLPFVPGLENAPPETWGKLLDHNNSEHPIGDMAKHITQNVLESSSHAASGARPIAEKIAEFEGLILGKLIEVIHKGGITKFDEQTAQWSIEDKEAVKGTTDFIIGGRMLTKGKMGEIALASTREYLQKNLPKTGFQIYPMTGVDLGKIAAYGTINFAGKEEIKKAIEKISK